MSYRLFYWLTKTCRILILIQSLGKKVINIHDFLLLTMHVILLSLSSSSDVATSCGPAMMVHPASATSLNSNF